MGFWASDRLIPAAKSLYFLQMSTFLIAFYESYLFKILSVGVWLSQCVTQLSRIVSTPAYREKIHLYDARRTFCYNVEVTHQKLSYTDVRPNTPWSLAWLVEDTKHPQRRKLMVPNRLFYCTDWGSFPQFRIKLLTALGYYRNSAISQDINSSGQTLGK